MTYVAVASLIFVFWAWLFDLVGLPVAVAFVPSLASVVGFGLWDLRWSGLFLEADGHCWYRNWLRRHDIPSGPLDRPAVNWRWRRGLWCLEFRSSASTRHLVTSVSVVRKDFDTQQRVEETLRRFGIAVSGGDQRGVAARD
jgi:hypothetical protein